MFVFFMINRVLKYLLVMLLAAPKSKRKGVVFSDIPVSGIGVLISPESPDWYFQNVQDQAETRCVF